MPEAFPTDAIPNNGWVMELADLRNPHITRVGNLEKGTETIEVVDGGSNRAFKFSAGVIRHEDLEIVRTRDGSEDDTRYIALFEQAMSGGEKVSGQLIQYRQSNQVMVISFEGMLFNRFSMTDMDVHASDKSDITFTVPVDWWSLDFTVRPAT